VATITVTEVAGPGATFLFPVAQGQNFLTITDTDGGFLQLVRLASTVDVNDIRQTRISGAGESTVPEPATYMLLAMGLGLIGLAPKLKAK
jgi:hypothetical protein